LAPQQRKKGKKKILSKCQVGKKGIRRLPIKKRPHRKKTRRSRAKKTMNPRSILNLYSKVRRVNRRRPHNLKSLLSG
jgi:hypothetical protein